jgi:hypothetical protein
MRRRLGAGRLWTTCSFAVDLDHRPVRVHGDDPAAGEAPQQTGTLQVIQGACWMTSEQGLSVPAEVDSATDSSARHSKGPASDAAALRCW